MMASGFPLIPEDILDNLTFWGLGTGSLAAIIYTFFVVKQFRETVRLRRLSLLPKLTGYLERCQDELGNDTTCLILKNIGNGTAVNISADPVVIRWDEQTLISISGTRCQSILPASQNESSTIKSIVHPRLIS